MRIFKGLVAISIFACCNGPGQEHANQDVSIKDLDHKCGNLDSLMKTLVNEFEPKTISLNEAIDGELRAFMFNVDLTCLKKQEYNREFVMSILAKQYLFHLKCCNQGYDLLTMRDNKAAEIIVESFIEIAGYSGSKLEMLNSGTVLKFIVSDSSMIRDNKFLKDIVSGIDRETARINEGVF
ncbi:MAG TPA: hypothetical protein VFR58_17550 [Flavisolibacter sp.]|nr:hypothetical protein [Flavisolibacter sp.]